jgi:Zn-dependent protease with chaperone function
LTTDFFENQDIARRKTGRLVFLFALAVIVTIAMLHALAAVVTGYQGVDPRTGATLWHIEWWDPDLLLKVALATLAVVGGGSLYKIVQLRAGGGTTVAESLGGRSVHADSSDPVERRLLNVVEEMAIASGIPTPPVYLLSQEDGINAFAAGFAADDAVVAVTRGAVENLSRDQLQGVIAHEFSHILNGDMRINIRLMGVLHGILILGIIGYFLFRSSMYGAAMGRRSSRDQSGMALVAAGLGLMVIGFIGSFFGSLIKASVSRQREFLADASAVQFTRNPGGIAGALKKIGGFAPGSNIENPNAPEASHLFFSLGVKSGLSSVFATHPPLAERIQRLDPSWQPHDSQQIEDAASAGRAPAAAAAMGFASAGDMASDLASAPGPSALEQIGKPTQAHLNQAARLIEQIPVALARAAHEPYGVRAVIYALVIDRDPEARARQLTQLDRDADAGVIAATRELLPVAQELDPALRMPLIDVALPALRALSEPQYQSFKRNLSALVEADDKIDLFEWTLQRILLHYLRPHFEKVKPPKVRHTSLGRLESEVATVLSTLAYADRAEEDALRRAFGRAAAHLKLPKLSPLPPQHCDLAAMDRALLTLSEVTPGRKRQILVACAEIIAADRRVSVPEAELFRAISSALGCPVPPVLPGQTLA